MAEKLLSPAEAVKQVRDQTGAGLDEAYEILNEAIQYGDPGTEYIDHRAWREYRGIRAEHQAGEEAYRGQAPTEGDAFSRGVFEGASPLATAAGYIADNFKGSPIGSEDVFEGYHQLEENVSPYLSEAWKIGTAGGLKSPELAGFAGSMVGGALPFMGVSKALGPLARGASRFLQGGVEASKGASILNPLANVRAAVNIAEEGAAGVGTAAMMEHPTADNNLVGGALGGGVGLGRNLLSRIAGNSLRALYTSNKQIRSAVDSLAGIEKVSSNELMDRLGTFGGLQSALDMHKSKVKVSTVDGMLPGDEALANQPTEFWKGPEVPGLQPVESGPSRTLEAGANVFRPGKSPFERTAEDLLEESTRPSPWAPEGTKIAPSSLTKPGREVRREYHETIPDQLFGRAQEAELSVGRMKAMEEKGFAFVDRRQVPTEGIGKLDAVTDSAKRYLDEGTIEFIDVRENPTGIALDLEGQTLVVDPDFLMKTPVPQLRRRLTEVMKGLERSDSGLIVQPGSPAMVAKARGDLGTLREPSIEVIEAIPRGSDNPFDSAALALGPVDEAAAERAFGMRSELLEELGIVAGEESPGGLRVYQPTAQTLDLLQRATPEDVVKVARQGYLERITEVEEQIARNLGGSIRGQRGAAGRLGPKGVPRKKRLGGLIHETVGPRSSPAEPGMFDRAWINTQGDIYTFPRGDMHVDWLRANLDKVPPEVAEKAKEGILPAMSATERLMDHKWIRKAAPDAYQVASADQIPKVIEHVQLYHPELRHVVVDIKGKPRGIAIPRDFERGALNFWAKGKKKVRPEDFIFDPESLARNPDDIAKIADDAPELLESEMTNGYYDEMKKSGIWKEVSIIHRYMARSKPGSEWAIATKEAKRQAIYKDGSQFRERLGRWIEDKGKNGKPIHGAGNLRGKGNEVSEHIEMTRLDENGMLVQTKADADPALNRAAFWWRQTILDPMKKKMTGVDPRAVAMVRARIAPPLNRDGTPIPETIWGPKVLKQLRGLQEMPVLDDPLMDLANRTRGMLEWDDAHRIEAAFMDDLFSMLRSKRERAALVLEKQKFEEDQATGIMTTREGQDIQIAIKLREEALAAFDKEVATKAARRDPRRDLVPRAQFFGPVAEANLPSARPFGWSRDFDNISRDLIDGMMGKRYLDQVYHLTRQALPKIDNPEVAQFMLDWVYAQRGAKGFASDRMWADTFSVYKRAIGSALGKKNIAPVTPDTMRKWTSELMKFNYLSKLAVSPRFWTINAAQPLMTLWPFVKSSNLGRAYARALSPKAWRRAIADGVIQMSDQHIIEAESYTGKAFTRALTKIPGGIENFNRVVAYEAGLLESAGKGFKPNRIVHGLFDYGLMAKGTNKAMRRAYARSLVDATQFVMGSEARPLAFSGGSIARLAGQFKSFTLGYLGLQRTAIQMMKAGDPTAFLKLNIALGMFGGMPAVLGAVPFAETFRRQAQKHLGFAWPQVTGLSYILEKAGFNGLTNLVDVSAAVNPYGIPKEFSWEEAGRFAAGPSFSTLFDTAEAANQEGVMSGPFLESLISNISPTLAGAGRLFKETSMGGSFTPGGERIANRPWWQSAATGAGMSPTVRQARYMAMNEARNALEGGHTELANQILKDAKDQYGIVWGPKTLASLKGSVKAARRRKARGLRMFE